MKLKKHIAVFAAAAAIGISLTACGALSEDAYFDKVENLDAAGYELSDAINSWKSAVDKKDTKAALENLDNVHEAVEKYGEFAKIKNPPKDFEEVHSELAAGVDGIKSSMQSLFDIFAKLSNNETLTDDEEKILNDSRKELQDYMTSLGEAYKELEKLKKAKEAE